ncbi:hypothetical protein CYK00_04930 [Neisseria sicca]|uniref:Uncharacterized protein n=1 Tax=Neisseria sicca TaxID=490 RepID=A0A2I1XD76_NEISI|nr:hypothetical protein CYK00_04930 [Neisseria sicca]
MALGKIKFVQPVEPPPPTRCKGSRPQIKTRSSENLNPKFSDDLFIFKPNLLDASCFQHALGEEHHACDEKC